MSTEARSALVPASVETPSDSPAAGPFAARASLLAPASPTAVVARDFVGQQTDAVAEGRALDGMALREGPHRDEIVKRLRRAEGQLRGIVRMLDEGQGCMAVAQQLTAVRKALDAAMTRMAVNDLEQELGERGQSDPNILPAVEHVGRLISRLA